MKNRKYITITCLSLIAWLTTSCLDLNPMAQLGDNIVWEKPANFQLFANQFYGWSRDLSDILNDAPHSDYRADLITAASVNPFSMGTNTIPSTDGNYGANYTRIYNTNLLLNHAATFADQSAITVPVAEAKFFRAYAYFDLVQLYGDVILVTKPLDLNSPEMKARRNDRSEVINQVINDLKAAADGLPETAPAEGKLTKFAALAMLSRVALYEGTWQKFHTGGKDATTNTTRSTELLTIAKDAASEVIKAGKYKLFYNDLLNTSSYRYMFILEDGAQCNPANLNKSSNTETIWAHRYRNGDKQALNVSKGMLANACFITRKMANMYLCSDGLPTSKSPLFKGYALPADEFLNRDNRMSNTMLKHGQQYWNNTSNNCRTAWTDADLTRALTLNARSNSGYQSYKWGAERLVADYYESMDFPVIRYAEVLLNYAEATYELGTTITDTDLDISLNLVRNRVNPNMPKLSNSFVTTNGLSMREEIRRERTLELVLEGFRLDDLKRWANASEEMTTDQLGVKVTGTWFEANWAAQSRSLNTDGCIIMSTGRVWKDKNYLYPLPLDQLQLNPNLGQNKGWE